MLSLRPRRIVPRLAALVAAAVLVLALVAALPAFTSAETKLLRFPDIYQDKVAFCHAGDIWIASADGGLAVRLTSHPGQELFPKFSPDGKWIAFTGQYDGDEQVYVMPVEGGVPKQLTFYPAKGPLPPRWGYDNQVYGWTRDGTSVLFRSMRYAWDLTDTRLYTVPMTGGFPEPLPMPVSGAGDFSPDGKKMIYSPLIRDFRTWKRYQGGWAQDLYIYDLATNEVTQVTDNPRTDRDPMWIDGKIYFDSDRDGKLNLYSYDVATKEIKQLTFEKTFDIGWPSCDDAGRIVYELDGELQIYDTTTGANKKISITVPDDAVAMRPSRVSAAKNIEQFGLSPKGERALFCARGDIFTAPIEKGPTRNLTNSSNAHDKWPAWSPDGKKIAFISDRTGEDEIYLVNQDGMGDLEQLTSNGHEMRYLPKWSPDGKQIAFTDKNGKIWVLDIATKKLTEVVDVKRDQTLDYTWSPDGNYLAFSMSGENEFSAVYIWSEKENKLHQVTPSLFNSGEPVWDPAGNYLFYLSDREYAPRIGSIEWNYEVDRNTGIFAVTLRKDVKNLFPYQSDEVKTDEDKKEDKTADKKKDEKKEEKKKKEPIKIDFEGLELRVMRVPVEADNMGGLEAIEDNLIFVRRGGFYYGRESDKKPAIAIFSIKDREESVLAQDAGSYQISQDGKKLLARSGPAYKLYDAKPKPGDPKVVSTADLMCDRVPAQEWTEIFNEVWRRFRDFFYVSNMNGYDWQKIGDEYRPLLKYVGHRADLNYLLGQMIGELTSSHSYIQGGDYDIPPRPPVGLLGARFELDKASGRYKIVEILKGENEEERYRAPLTEIGVDVKLGDYLLAVDGEEIATGIDPYAYFRYKADRPIVLTVNSRPDMKDARKVTIDPVSDEGELRYLSWVERNRAYVDKATDGRVGYLHIPDMSEDGIREFIKWYYGQLRKEGLVIDVRGNGGGNVSQMLIERLRRTLLSVDYSRNSDYPEPYPNTVFNGHLVCLLNETSASDGDIFPAMFRKAGLGPLIGKRSWGGVIGISGHGPLIDGGNVFVPEYGFVNTEGQWDIENRGVEPDIVVENDPKSVIAGRDPQLDRGIEEVMKAIMADPKHFPPRPPAPDKTK
jgi:tricorn protease